MSTLAVRQRFERLLAGETADRPVYAVYDWFVQNRPFVDWPSLFDLGLGEINHATLIEHHRPHLQIVETTSEDDSGMSRRDVRWITDIGELHEWYLGEWRQEHLIKTTEDYRIMARALSDVEIRPTMAAFEASEAAVADNGITFGVPETNRTAFQKIQIDYVGLEQFSLDVAMEVPELLALVEQIDDQLVREIEVIADLPVPHLKLWENLTIETMGPRLYRQYLTPTYERIFAILRRSGQRLHPHYDGNLRIIANDIGDFSFGGIDSFTEPPEGDMTIAQAREAWPDKFLWLHPNLGWYQLPKEALYENLRRSIQAAGPTRYCFMISEEIPPDWEETVPLILEFLKSTTSH